MPMKIIYVSNSNTLSKQQNSRKFLNNHFQENCTAIVYNLNPNASSFILQSKISASVCRKELTMEQNLQKWQETGTANCVL